MILIFDGVVFATGGAEGMSARPFTLSAFQTSSVGIAFLFAATCFLGFEATAIFRDEVRNPNKTIPRATYSAVLLIGLFYVFASWMIITAYGVGHAQEVATNSPSTVPRPCSITWAGLGLISAVCYSRHHYLQAACRDRISCHDICSTSDSTVRYPAS